MQLGAMGALKGLSRRLNRGELPPMMYRPPLPEQGDVLRPRMADMIDPQHELVKLAARIDWDVFEREGGAMRNEGRPVSR